MCILTFSRCNKNTYNFDVIDGDNIFGRRKQNAIMISAQSLSRELWNLLRKLSFEKIEFYESCIDAFLSAMAQKNVSFIHFGFRFGDDIFVITSLLCFGECIKSWI